MANSRHSSNNIIILSGTAVLLAVFLLGWMARGLLYMDVDAINKRIAVCERANSSAKSINSRVVVCHNGAIINTSGDK